MSTSTEDRREAMRLRREERKAAAAAASGGGGSGSNSLAATASSPGFRGRHHQNLGDKPLQESVYSTSLRVLGHSASGQVIFTTSHLPSLGLTSVKPISQLGNQLQRIILDNNALESLEDLRDCVSLVHLSVAGNKLDQNGIFKYLVSSASTLNHLNVSDNKITSLSGVEKLRFLVTLLVDKNQLSTLEVDSTEDAMRQSANENIGEHQAKLLDDIINAIDEENAKGKRPSRRNSIHDHQPPTALHGRQPSLRFGKDSGPSSKFASSRSVTFGATNQSGEDLSGGLSEGPQTSPLRFLVSLWRFSAAENELKFIHPKVFERCPLRLLNLSNNALTNLDFVLPLHKSLMVLIADSNEICHLPASSSSSTAVGSSSSHNSSGYGTLRRASSRHLTDHPSKTALHPDVSHLNFNMMTRLVSLNLGQNNIASFQEIAELKQLPQLRHLTLSNCTLCSLPTASDLDNREKNSQVRRHDEIRCDSLTAEELMNNKNNKNNKNTVGGPLSSGTVPTLDDQLADTIDGGDETFSSASGLNETGRKKSSVLIQSPSMEYNSLNNDDNSGPGSNSQSFSVEALIRPDDSEQVTLRTPEEQDQAEFNKRTTEERYRLRILQSVPQLQTLDGIACSTEDIAEAQQLAGGHLRDERTKAITKYIKPTSGAAGAALRKLVHRQD